MFVIIGLFKFSSNLGDNVLLKLTLLGVWYMIKPTIPSEIALTTLAYSTLSAIFWRSFQILNFALTAEQIQNLFQTSCACSSEGPASHCRVTILFVNHRILSVPERVLIVATLCFENNPFISVFCLFNKKN